MSFFSDLTRGNFSNLGHDLYAQYKSNPLETLALGAGAIALPFAAPELLGAAGIGAGAAGAADVGAAAAGAGAPLDILAGSQAAGTAGLEGLGSVIPAEGAAGAGLAPELTQAGVSGFPGAVPGVTTGLGAVAGTAGIPGTNALAFSPSAGGIGSDADLPSIITTGTSGGGAGVLDNLAATGELTGGGPAPLDLSGGAPSLSSASPGFASSALNWIKSNPLLAGELGLGAAAAGIPLLKNLASPKLPYQDQLTGAASNLGQTGQQLTAEGQGLLGPIQGGPLPPALETQVTQALNDSIATTKARFAQLGLSGSTMESDQISYLQQNAEAMRGTLALQLAQAGTNLISQASSDFSTESNIYGQLMQTQISQDTALEQSIAQFAGQAAMATALSSRPNVNLKVANA